MSFSSPEFHEAAEGGQTTKKVSSRLRVIRASQSDIQYRSTIVDPLTTMATIHNTVRGGAYRTPRGWFVWLQRRPSSTYRARQGIRFSGVLFSVRTSWSCIQWRPDVIPVSVPWIPYSANEG